MKKEALLSEINSCQEFFERSTRVLEEKDSNYMPSDGMLTAAQQMAHVAQTIHWFIQGAFSPEGFDMDFEAHIAEYSKATSITAERASLKKAFTAAISIIENLSDAELAKPIAEGPVMGGAPRYHAFIGLIDHTAHHRGSLAVYARLLNKVPLMPYMEM